MSNVTIPRGQWDEFLDGFSERHAGWLACLETHDTKTGETVSTRYLPFEEIVLDTEDTKNARINVTVSIGVAVLGQHGNDLFELLAAADVALYRAKDAGRDQVRIYAHAAGNAKEPTMRQKMLEQIPLGRWARPEEIANTILWLCSDLAGYVTGQTINVNGGWYCG